ncbi:MAG: universal stress protein [Caldilineaceae bacterium]
MSKNNVLALIDGSEFSLLILHYIKQFLTPATHAVLLFCVKEEPPLLQPEHAAQADFSADFLRERETLAQKIVHELEPQQRTLEAAGFDTSIAVRFGDPVQEIDQFLDENKIDLIAMTTHGRTGLRRVLVGSVAQHLLQHAALPILLYRPLGYA